MAVINTLIGGNTGRQKAYDMCKVELTGPDQITVTGLANYETIKPNISFSPTYGSVSDAIGGLPLLGQDGIVNKLSNAILGAGVFNTGIWTRQYYTGNGQKNYVSVSFDMKLVDNTGSGNHTKATAMLAKWVSPKTLTSFNQQTVDQNAESFSDAQVAGSNFVNEVGQFSETKTKLEDDGNSELVATVGAAGQTVKPILDLMDKNSRICKLKIGDYFGIDKCVIKQLSIEFSKEQGLNGPLYYDVSLTIEGAEILDDVGISNLFLSSLGSESQISVRESRITWKTDSNIDTRNNNVGVR